MSVDRITVSEWGDVERSSLAGREAETVVRLLTGGRGLVLVFEEWLAEKKDIRAVENERRIFDVSLLGESEKAWHVKTGDHDDWVPKSQSMLFERGSEEIDTPTRTLGEFGSGGGRE